MSFCIIGVAKQKGGSVGSSGLHNDRGRETPNADPEREHLNRVLIGPDRGVRELVTEVIEEHGGKPRRDSVEAVEILLSASPEFFEDEDERKAAEKLERFVEQAVKFLEDPRNCGRCVKAVLHLDERTPHIHAHKVPIDPEGRLNASHYLDGRARMRALHDRYAEVMRPLGLERGREGSRATHQTVKQFYASIEREVELKIDHARVPDPPRIMLTAEAAAKYKEQVLAAVLDQLKEPIRTLRHQAMLTKDERARRLEAESRAEARVAAAHEENRAEVAAVERRAEERFANLQRSAKTLVEENKDLHAAAGRLLAQRDALNGLYAEAARAGAAERARAEAAERSVAELAGRLSDVPLVEVLERLGYGPGEERGVARAYFDEAGRVAMTVRGQSAVDHGAGAEFRNSLALVSHVRTSWEGHEDFDTGRALRWVRSEFGEKKAAGAMLAYTEQGVTQLFERERERETRSPAQERSDAPWRGPQERAEVYDRADGPDLSIER